MTDPYDIEDLISDLERRGCKPGLSFRGGEKPYRFHVNSCGNFWANAASPRVAARMAIYAWEQDGCPKDGMADK